MNGDGRTEKDEGFDHVPLVPSITVAKKYSIELAGPVT